MSYLEKLKSPKWQKKRLEILKRDKFICKKCGDTETTLHVHHIKYTVDLPENESSENLITLCENCHQIEPDAFNNEIENSKVFFQKKGFTSFHVSIFLHNLVTNEEVQ